jgi:hypothetical protein
MSNFQFTFKTDAEYFSKKFTGYIPNYECVRMTIARPNGNTIDFPIHTEEEYITYLSKYVKNGDTIINTYPSTTFYESEYNY